MKAFFFFIFLGLSGPGAQAQELFADLLSPLPPALQLRGSAESAHPTTQQKFLASVPLISSADHTLTVSWKWSQLNLGSEEKLTNGGSLPPHFYNNDFGLGFKKNVDAETFWGWTSSIGSAGDQVFRSRTKTVWNVTGFYSSSPDPSSRWVWLLNISNNRSFLNEIPVPGVAYIYRPNPEFTGFFGFPFLFFRWKFAEQWNSQFVLGPFTYKAEVSRSLVGPLQAYGSADNTVQAYYRAQRLREEERLFYNESRLVVGMKSPVNRSVFADVFAGMIYNRSVVERENFSGFSADSRTLGNEIVIGTQVSARFPTSVF